MIRILRDLRELFRAIWRIVIPQQDSGCEEDVAEQTPADIEESADIYSPIDAADDVEAADVEVNSQPRHKARRRAWKIKKQGRAKFMTTFDI